MMPVRMLNILLAGFRFTILAAGIVLFFGLKISLADGSGSRGDGGGAYLCSPAYGDTSQKTFSRIFSIDYIHSRLSNEKPHPFAAHSCEDRLHEVAFRLNRSDPFLSAGLESFIASFPWISTPKESGANQKEPPSFSRSWDLRCSGNIGCLSDIPDDQISAEVAMRCRKIQVAHRLASSRSGRIATQLDSAAFALLRKSPEQCMYFLLHEWSRDFLKDAAQIRKFLSALLSDEFWNNNDRKALDLADLPKPAKECLTNSDPLQQYRTFMNTLGNLSITPSLDSYYLTMVQFFPEGYPIDREIGLIKKAGATEVRRLSEKGFHLLYSRWPIFK